jgi:hypothetical protein
MVSGCTASIRGCPAVAPRPDDSVSAGVKFSRTPELLRALNSGFRTSDAVGKARGGPVVTATAEVNHVLSFHSLQFTPAVQTSKVRGLMEP